MIEFGRLRTEQEKGKTMNKLTKEVYKVAEVKQACERAERRLRETGEDWAVYVDVNCPTRTWTTPSEEPVTCGQCVYDTADGGFLL